MERVSINRDQCEKVGKTVGKLHFRLSFYEREFLTLHVDTEIQYRAYIYAVAICHQTHPLIHKALNLKGWDYIEKVFLELALDDSKLLHPGYFASLQVKEIVELVRELFSEDGNPQHTTMDRLKERSSFLKGVDQFLEKEFDGSVVRMIDASEKYLVSEEKGLYKILEKMEAYTDPSRKKSTYFIKLLLDAKLIEIKDPENFVPVMDYHMQRVLLRMGCVKVLDKQLQNDLKKHKKLDSDADIREACIGAIKEIASISGHKIVEMNDFFWPLGRSCCRETTLCADKVCVKNPCTLELVVDIPSHGRCAFEDVCNGYQDSKYREYWQPVVDTHYY